MEALNCLLRRARQGDFLSCFKVMRRGCEGMEVSHLYAFEGEALWKQVIDGKYREKGGWHTFKVRADYSVGLWKITGRDVIFLTLEHPLW